MPRIAASRTALYVAAAALALAAPPLLLRAQPDNWNSVRAAVEGMQQADRDRLDRNTREYQALTDAERERYRRLHAALQEDARNSNGRLNATMQDYYAWLASNQAYDRQKLRTTTDPVQRVEEARRIVDERNAATSRSRAWRSRSRWWLWDAPDLTSEQLEVLMRAVEDQMALSVDERHRLSDDDHAEKVGVERYFTVFSILRNRRDKLHRLLERLDVDAAVDAVPDLQLPQGFAELPREARHAWLLRTIVGNVLQEYESAVNQRPATTKELADFVAHWPGEQQELDRLLELEPSEFRPQLEQRYAKQANALDMRDLDEVLPGPGDFRDLGGGFGGPFGGFRRGRGEGRRGPGGSFLDRQGDSPPFQGRPGDAPFSRRPEGEFGPDDRDRGPPPDGPPPDGPPRDGLRPPPPGDGQSPRPRAGERPNPRPTN